MGVYICSNLATGRVRLMLCNSEYHLASQLSSLMCKRLTILIHWEALALILQSFAVFRPSNCWLGFLTEANKMWHRPPLNLLRLCRPVSSKMLAPTMHATQLGSDTCQVLTVISPSPSSTVLSSVYVQVPPDSTKAWEPLASGAARVASPSSLPQSSVASRPDYPP